MHSFIDKRHFLTDLSEIASRIRLLKSALGARWQRPMAAEQRELVQLKLRATELCVFRAFTRGKLHVRFGHADDAESAALEYHRRIVERLSPVYALRLEQSA